MTRNFGAESTAREVVEGLDLAARRAIVTGASGGLGAETAAALASRGARVTLAARNLAKAQGVADAICEETPGARVDVLEIELSVPKQVRSFAERFRERHGDLDLLINNAGIMACPLARTEEGWELQFATNHLGHFLLTGLLTPLLRESGDARVVNLSSGGHRFAPEISDDPHFEQHPYEKFEAYGQSKTANVLFSLELDRRLRDAGVRAFAVHPGVIMTELARHMTQEDIEGLQSRSPGRRLSFKSVGAGAATSTWAATAPELSGQGGIYLEDCGIAEVNESPDGASGVHPGALDPDAAARLWSLSEELLGERFD